MVSAPASEKSAATPHAASCTRGCGKTRATSLAVRKTAEPIITPAFTMVASRSPSALLSSGAMASARETGEEPVEVVDACLARGRVAAAMVEPRADALLHLFDDRLVL